MNESREPKRRLELRVETLRSQLTPAFVEETVRTLLWREGEDPGGGINAMRLVKYWLEPPSLSDVELVWAYERIKPTFRLVLQQTPSLYYFEGD